MSQGGGKPIDKKALFVSGLAADVGFLDLNAHFDRFGEIVLTRVLMDARTGQSRCIGYVNFKTEASAAVAQQATHNQPGPKQGPNLSVRFADADPTFVPIATTKVFIRFVPMRINPADVKAAFERYGVVQGVEVEVDHTNTVHKGCPQWKMAYVLFETRAEAEKAVANARDDIKWDTQNPLIIKPAEGEQTKKLRKERRNADFASPSVSVTVGKRGIPNATSPHTGPRPFVGPVPRGALSSPAAFPAPSSGYAPVPPPMSMATALPQNPHTVMTFPPGDSSSALHTLVQQGSPTFNAQGTPTFAAQGTPTFAAQGTPTFNAQGIPTFDSGIATHAPHRYHHYHAQFSPPVHPSQYSPHYPGVYTFVSSGNPQAFGNPETVVGPSTGGGASGFIVYQPATHSSPSAPLMHLAPGPLDATPNSHLYNAPSAWIVPSGPHAMPAGHAMMPAGPLHTHHHLSAPTSQYVAAPGGAAAAPPAASPPAFRPTVYCYHPTAPSGYS